MADPVQEGQVISEHEGKNPSRKHAWRYNSWISGAVLVIIGVMVLLQNYGVVTFVDIHNWWALFILIPTLGAWSTALGMYLANGRKLNRTVLRVAYGGVWPFFIAIVFLFDLNWGKVWPFFLILAGVSSLLWGGVGPRHSHRRE